MAHKKGVGSSRNGRESHSKRLGIKIFGGSMAIAGNIIVRQRGTQHNPGPNVGMGKDHTLYALCDGKVVFRKRTGNKSYVSVEPVSAEPQAVNAVSELPARETPAQNDPVEVVDQETDVVSSKDEVEVVAETSSEADKESSE